MLITYRGALGVKFVEKPGLRPRLSVWSAEKQTVPGSRPRKRRTSPVRKPHLGDRHSHDPPPGLCDQPAKAQANRGAVWLGQSIGGLARPMLRGSKGAR
jgi:hypothetical protein